MFDSCQTQNGAYSIQNRLDIRPDSPTGFELNDLSMNRVKSSEMQEAPEIRKVQNTSM